MRWSFRSIYHLSDLRYSSTRQRNIMSTTFISVPHFPGSQATAPALRRKHLATTSARPGGLTRHPAARRAYLKALRNAESAAWEAKSPRAESAASPLRRAKTELQQQRRGDVWFFTVIAGIAATTLVFAFRDSLDITERFADFARFIGQLIG